MILVVVIKVVSWCDYEYECFLFLKMPLYLLHVHLCNIYQEEDSCFLRVYCLVDTEPRSLYAVGKCNRKMSVKERVRDVYYGLNVKRYVGKRQK